MATLLALVVVAGILITGITVALRSRQPGSTVASAASQGMDPFTLQDPWRRHMQNARAARAKVAAAIDARQEGPTKERLGDLCREIDDIVARVWEVASEGHRLAAATRMTDLPSLERRLRDAEATPTSDPRGVIVADPAETPLGTDASVTTGSALDSARASVDAARRIAATRDQADAHLRALNDRLAELVVRAIEVTTVQVASTDTDTLRTDLDAMIVDLEGLRQGLQETRQIAQA